MTRRVAKFGAARDRHGALDSGRAGFAQEAQDWLLALVSISEPFGKGSDDLEPELMSVEYDDAATMAYHGESGEPSTPDPLALLVDRGDAFS